MNLPADISRCNGVPDETVCIDCLRRVQIAKDAEDRWFPYLQGNPRNGRCQFKILMHGRFNP